EADMPMASPAPTIEPFSTTVANSAMRLSCSIMKLRLTIPVHEATFSRVYPAAIMCSPQLLEVHPMKIALIGATGYVGAPLLQEALQRGHQVTALVRHPEKLAAHPRLSAVQANVQDTAKLAEQLRGHDVVISAFNPGWGVADIRE